jgi:hypothetical protein
MGDLPSDKCLDCHRIIRRRDTRRTISTSALERRRHLAAMRGEISRASSRRNLSD